MPPKVKAKSTPARSSHGQQYKNTPKKQVPTDVKTSKLYKTLAAQIDAGHNASAVVSSDKLLRLDPNDTVAFNMKLSLLVQMDEFAKAAEMLAEGNERGLVYAYTMYKLAKYAETRQALASGEGRGFMHLKAQLDYREGRLQDSLDLYNELLETAPDEAIDAEEHTDIQNNIKAVEQQLEFIQTGYLRSLDALPAAVAASLESAPPPSIPSAPPSLPTTTTTTSKPITANSKQEKKVKLPKGVVLGVTPMPDPERWVKKSERTTTTQYGKKRKTGAGGGATQGASAEPSTKAKGGKKRK